MLLGNNIFQSHASAAVSRPFLILFWISWIEESDAQSRVSRVTSFRRATRLREGKKKQESRREQAYPPHTHPSPLLPKRSSHGLRVPIPPEKRRRETLVPPKWKQKVPFKKFPSESDPISISFHFFSSLNEDWIHLTRPTDPRNPAATVPHIVSN